MCYTTFSVGLKDMEKIQQMKNLEELKEKKNEKNLLVVELLLLIVNLEKVLLVKRQKKNN